MEKIPILSSKNQQCEYTYNVRELMKMKFGIYYENQRVWGRFDSYEQATNFIEKYDLEQQYEVRSYY